MSGRSFVVLALISAWSAGCSGPSAPGAPESTTVHVTGRVLAYHQAASFNPIGGATLLAWIADAGGSRPAGPIPLDSNGRFDLVVERGARVRLYAGGDRGSEIYQPCAVTLTANGNVNRDVRVVNDYRVIGAAVPPVFLQDTRTLSGLVYESMPDGGRRPLPFATVSIGGFREFDHELGWPIANTRTDADGRYVICGLEADTSAKVYVVNFTHEMSVTDVPLTGDTVLDVELTPEIARQPLGRKRS